MYLTVKLILTLYSAYFILSTFHFFSFSQFTLHTTYHFVWCQLRFSHPSFKNTSQPTASLSFLFLQSMAIKTTLIKSLTVPVGLNPGLKSLLVFQRDRVKINLCVTPFKTDNLDTDATPGHISTEYKHATYYTLHA